MKTASQALMFCLLAMALLGAGQVAAATEPVARVVVAAGNVTARNDETARALERRSPIYEEETVLTGVDSRAQLRFSDGALLSLDPQTELVIETYRRNPEDPGKSRALLRMVEGGLRTITGAIAEEFPEGYEVKTPVAGIGVRGTDFEVVIADEELVAAAWQGRVLVSNSAGQLRIGDGHAYRFARVPGRNLAPVGLLQAPSLLTQAMPVTGEDVDAASRAEADDAEAPSDREVGRASQRAAGQRALGAALGELSNDTVRDAFAGRDDPLREDRLRDDPTDLSVPDWFASFEERTRSGAHFSRSNFGIERISGGGSRVSDPRTAEGMTIPVGSRRLTEQDVGRLVPPQALARATEIADFPVIWGRWNDADEMYSFFNSPDEDGNFDPDDPSSVDFGSPEELGLARGGWVAATEPALSLMDVAALRPSGTVRFGSGENFATGPVRVLDSAFSAGTLDESQSFMEFEVDLDEAVLTGGAMEIVVAGDGFDEVWAWQADDAVFANGSVFQESADTPFAKATAVFGQDTLSVFRTDESLNAEFVQSQVSGFIVESGENTIGNDEQLGFVGAGSFTARDGDVNGNASEDGEILSDGALLIILPEN